MPGSVLESRLEKAYELSHDNERLIVVSGKGEAAVMAHWLRMRGIASERIIEEHEATSTNENLENAAALLRDRGNSDFCVVTSGFHKWRTRAWAWHLGMNIVVFGAPTPRRHRTWLVIRESTALIHSYARIAWRRLRAHSSRP
ncbi:YdcF family protein [Corynebacterium sp. sy039]|uniref:YdcF family protein n=1 Tax=Corynebacterium sp. sy039 TaxID=2599641 RepID=UPI0011B56F55|nr:YdcF family protein [Corynebacterium sp. sy039]QDZ43480.1 YdcF family protein [Corynebacterium sp. sy039]